MLNTVVNTTVQNTVETVEVVKPVVAGGPFFRSSELRLSGFLLFFFFFLGGGSWTPGIQGLARNLRPLQSVEGLGNRRIPSSCCSFMGYKSMYMRCSKADRGGFGGCLASFRSSYYQAGSMKVAVHDAPQELLIRLILQVQIR